MGGRVAITYMAAKAFPGASSNRTCQLCGVSDATHFCSCQRTPTLFCLDCSGRHNPKFTRIHNVMPVAALNQNSDTYMQKSEALMKGVIELRRNVEKLDQFCRDFDEMMQNCINYLSEYRSSLLGKMQEERERLSAAIETAVQETNSCLDQGIEPVSDLANILWTVPAEELQIISCSVTPPDLLALCQTWATYTNHMQSLCERKNSTVPMNIYATVRGKEVELFDIKLQQSTKHNITVGITSCIQLNSSTILCLGTSRQVYELKVPSLQLTSLPSLHTDRSMSGLAKTANFVYVFGGMNLSNVLKSCEQYTLRDRQWLPLEDMIESKFWFTPCPYHTLIYLPCPQTTRSIETFNTETEAFTMLAVSLPPQFKVPGLSVAFVANGELCIMNQHSQMGRWNIESEREFRLSTVDRLCASSQPPLVVGSLVLIASVFAIQKLEKFSLESYTFL